LLSGDVNDKETNEQFLRIIYDESERLNRLLTDLLNLSKIEKQAMPLKITEVNSIKVINDTTKTISKLASDKKIAIHLRDDNVAVNIEAYLARLSQIILHLMANAVTYTSENGHVYVDVDSRTTEVYISIRDTSMGIPPESLERLFERFYRVDKARSRNSGGTGLGLAIV